MRFKTSLSEDEASLVMVLALEAEGVRVTQTVPLVRGHVTSIRNGVISRDTVLVSVVGSPGGSVVTVNGQNAAYMAGRRAVRSLPRQPGSDGERPPTA